MYTTDGWSELDLSPHYRESNRLQPVKIQLHDLWGVYIYTCVALLCWWQILCTVSYKVGPTMDYSFSGTFHGSLVRFGSGEFWGHYDSFSSSSDPLAVAEQFLWCCSIHRPRGWPTVIRLCRCHGGNSWSFKGVWGRMWEGNSMNARIKCFTTELF